LSLVEKMRRFASVLCHANDIALRFAAFHLIDDN